jgi:hypothetical protein
VKTAASTSTSTTGSLAERPGPNGSGPKTRARITPIASGSEISQNLCSKRAPERLRVKKLREKNLRLLTFLGDEDMYSVEGLI